MEKSIKAVIVGAFSALTAWLGILAIPVYVLVLSNILDYLTGIMAAKSRGEHFSPEIGLRGIAKKIGQWILVLVGYMIDLMLDYAAESFNDSFHLPIIVAIAVALWLNFNEFFSILKNLKDIGVPLPEFIMKAVNFFLHRVEDIGESAIPDEEGEGADKHESN